MTNLSEQKMALEITPELLNRTIVGFRKTVQKCRVICSRKIIQQIQLLTNKKGTPDQTEKYKRKVERLTEELKIVKKTNTDQVTKFALVNTKTLTELLATVPQADKAVLCKLAMCDFMVKKIDEFRDKHPSWPVEVPFTLQRLGLQYKIKKNEPSKHILKQMAREAMTHKNQSTENTEPSSSVMTGNRDSSNGSNNGRQSRKKLNHKTKIHKQEEQRFTTTDQKAIKIEKRSNSKSKPEPKLPVSVEHTAAPQQAPSTVSVREGTIGQMEVRRLKLDEIFSDEIQISSVNPQKEHKSKSDKNLSVPTHLKQDSFFDTGEGSSYEDNDQPIQQEDDDNLDALLEDEYDDRLKNSRKIIGKSNRLKSKFSSSLKAGPDDEAKLDTVPPKNRPPNRMKFGAKSANTVPLGKARTDANVVGNRKMRRLKMREEENTKAEIASLHPSWLAKKKSNSTILAAPAGKKIKFSDD